MTVATKNGLIRPTTFDDIVGQTEAITLLRRAVEAAHARGDLPPHILLIGGPGLGKTTIMRALANEIGGRFVPLFGVNMRGASDVFGPLLKARPRDVMGIDEIHRMYRTVQEMLYTVMEDGRLHVDGGGELIVPPLVVVGATTDPDRLTSPMLDRFGLIVRLRPYSIAELVEVGHKTAAGLGATLSEDAATLIAQSAEGTPRKVIRLVRASRDVAQMNDRPDRRGDRAVVLPEDVRTVLTDPALVWDLEGRDAG